MRTTEPCTRYYPSVRRGIREGILVRGMKASLKEMHGSRAESNPVKHKSISGEALVLHGVTITHPDRIVFEDGTITKGDVARYYAAVAPHLLGEIQNRPISLLRCPGGMNDDCFYQRNVGSGLGPDVYPFSWKYKGRSYKYIYVKDVKGIMEMVQMGTIEIHPWGATIDKIHTPDRMIFDLDPAPDVPFSEVKRGAVEVRARLKSRRLESFLKCTGGNGLHVVVPLSPARSWEEVKRWASAFAHEMVGQMPDKYVATITKSKRKGKILIDFFRNDYTATGIAGYSLRARRGAPVAVPLGWRELAKLTSGSQFGMDTVLRRIRSRPLRKALPQQDLPGWK